MEFCQYFCLFLGDCLILFDEEKLSELLLEQVLQMGIENEG